MYKTPYPDATISPSPRCTTFLSHIVDGLLTNGADASMVSAHLLSKHVSYISSLKGRQVGPLDRGTENKKGFQKTTVTTTEQIRLLTGSCNICNFSSS